MTPEDARIIVAQAEATANLLTAIRVLQEATRPVETTKKK
jgi:hypothetical protein